MAATGAATGTVTAVGARAVGARATPPLACAALLIWVAGEAGTGVAGSGSAAWRSFCNHLRCSSAEAKKAWSVIKSASACGGRDGARMPGASWRRKLQSTPKGVAPAPGGSVAGMAAHIWRNGYVARRAQREDES